MDFSHLDAKGQAVMVDVSAKPPVRRTARAAGRITMLPATVERLRAATIEKGDALAVARVAGIAAAKRTADLIPLCHAIRIDQVGVEFTLTDDAVEVEAHAVCTDRTGIEMEVLTAVSVAALTLYDMCKAVDSTMRITDVRLLEKTKGTEA